MNKRPPRKRRALLVGAGGRCGGAEISLALLARHLSLQGLVVGLLCPNTALPQRSFLEADLWRCSLVCFESVRPASLSRCLTLLAAGWSNFLRIDEAMRTFQPDIVHANDVAAFLTAVPFAKLRHTPIIWHVRDFFPAGKIVAWCGRCADGIVAVSRAIRAHLVRHGFDPRKITVVPNGIEADGLTSERSAHLHDAICARLGWPRESFIYLNVGQYVPWKRQDVFLDAAARVAPRSGRARFLLIGGLPRDGSTAWRSHVEKLIVARKLSGRARMLHWQDAMDEFWGGADVLVHTARREPFGRVLIEAMAMGVPVIAPRTAGPAEIVTDEVTGLLFESDDLAALVTCMERLQDQHGLGARLVSQAQARVLARFTAERTAQSVRRIYVRVWAGGGRIEGSQRAGRRHEDIPSPEGVAWRRGCWR